MVNTVCANNKSNISTTKIPDVIRRVGDHNLQVSNKAERGWKLHAIMKKNDINNFIGNVSRRS